MKKFRAPQARKQGMKLLAYGENGSGKSIFALTFPQIGYVDSESKVGVYENDPRFRDNLVGIADTAEYYDVVGLMETVIKDTKTFSTLVVDSLTSINDGMQVAAMEQEEARAKKKGGNVDDATVSMRGWGKIKLNTTRVNQLIAQASANGVTTVTIAHKEDINQEIGGKRVKVGERAALRPNAEHTYDVILKFYKEKDMVTQEMKYYAEVEKDTTGTYKVGDKVENVTYENFKEYVERSNKSDAIKSDYDKTIETTKGNMQEEQTSHDELVKEFKAIYKEKLAKDQANKDIVTNMMKEKDVVKYNDTAKSAQLKELIEDMKKL
ncbi:AAA family ATPase [Priestia aryabhattai]|uniref:AAA family ATPase n=1 Tax=Priestia aryabhattai TaxID=412384 RepID=UPI0035323495